MIGILGGTFDPVHYGHLLPALETARALELAGLRLVPAARPPHRPPPVAAAAQRLRMIELALAERPDYAAAGFRIDPREIERPGPSYTVLTLESMRVEHGRTPLCLLMGTDSLLGFERWHRWPEIPVLAHLVVMQRPGWTVETPPRWVEARRACTPAELHAAPAGRVWFQPVTARDISSTRIRERLARGEPVAGLVPAAVADYIARHRLYR